ncbi:MAG: MMPL family transporter [Polyangiaceae bacterium]|nr:MMPL family transporter [Polyangiaceae bacterium]
MVQRVVTFLVSYAIRAPWRVVMMALGMMTLFGLYASRIEVRTELLELLPRDSPGFRAFEHQMGRAGGASSLVLVVHSPDRKKNEAFVDALAAKLDEKLLAQKACTAKCNAQAGPCVDACGGNRISYVESTTKDVHAFYERNKWLYASVADLEAADRDLDRQIALRTGLVEDLLTDTPAPAPQGSASPSPTEKPAEKKKKAFGLDEYLERWDSVLKRRENYPTGYFANDDGTYFAVRVVSSARLGGSAGDAVLRDAKEIVASVSPASFHPAMVVGYAGDLASASSEKEAIMSEAVGATLLAFLVILLGLVAYYRSIWSPVIILIPVFFGITAAYAFANAALGYINTAGAFLGAIILGNGINYPIVLLSRYQEFRASGQSPDEAKHEAVQNAFRAELVGALVASIAYGSLIFTRFRGFSQFGTIGFVGMLVVWAAIVPLIPALVTISERMQAKLPASLLWLRDRPIEIHEDGSRSWGMRMLAKLPTRYPVPMMALGLVVTVAALTRVPAYLHDPWEYDFSRLGSLSSRLTGAEQWSNRADEIYGGRGNLSGAMIVADTVEQVPLLKKQMLANDATDPQGRVLDDIVTAFDLLPGTEEEQKEKLGLLESIRSRVTPRVLSELSEEEQKTVKRAMPPEELPTLKIADLPPLFIRRFTENNGTQGTLFFVRPRNDVKFSDGRNHLRMSRTVDNVKLPDGTVVQTASRSSIFAEMLSSMRRDGPLVSMISFFSVLVVVVLASKSLQTALSVIAALLMGTIWLVAGAAVFDVKLNYINFIAIPITLGIGCEYPFNIADRTRLLGGNVAQAVMRSGGAVLLCSFTTTVGYGSLLYSDTQALASFGKLAVSGEVACIFTAIFFLPAMLTLVERRKARTKT